MAINVQFADYVSTSLAANVAASSGQTTIIVNSVAGFPSAGGGLYFYLTLGDVATGGASRREIVKVTSYAGTSLTVVRGVGGTSPGLFYPGDLAELRFNAISAQDIATGAGGAPTTSTYVLMTADAALANRRILTASGRVSVTDGGATNPVTLDLVASSIINSYLSTMPTLTIKGNNTGGTAAVADLTVAQVSAMVANSFVSNAGAVTSWAFGTHAARPAFGVVGRIYTEFDTLGTFYDTGAAWGLVFPALTGDVTNTLGTLAATISAGAVTNAKMANMPAGTFKANTTGGAVPPSDVTGIQAIGVLPDFVASGGSHARGIVPDPGVSAGNSKFLREDSSWQIPAGAGAQAHNYIINGGMVVAQRPTKTLSTALQYGSVDRFKVGVTVGTTSAGTIQQDTASTIGRTGFALKVAGASMAATPTLTVNYYIESKDAVNLINATASFGALCFQDTGGSLTYSASIYKATSQDNFTSTTLISTGTTSVPTSTGTQVLLQNVSMGACGNGVLLQISCTPGTVVTKNFSYSEWIFSEGAATPTFPYASFEDELQRARRYYQKSFPYATAPAQNAGLNGAVFYACQVSGVAGPWIFTVSLPRTMRLLSGSAVATFYNPAAANALWRNISAVADSGIAGTFGSGDTNFCFNNPQVAGDVVSHSIGVHYTLDADF